MMTTALQPEPKKGELLTRNAQELRQTLQAHAETVFAAMPRHMTKERMISICVRTFRKNPKLAECNPLSIIDAISQSAALGLEPDGVLGHAYLVPYGGECVLIPGYKGLIDLCRRSGNVSEVHLECVYEGDEFSYSKGLNPTLHHVPDDKNAMDDSSKITHVYVVIRLRDGGVQFDVWPRQRIEGHKSKFSKGWQWAESGDKKRGGGKQDSPWHTNWPEMAMKTVLRSMVARGKVPVSAEVQRLASMDEMVEGDYVPPARHDRRIGVSTLNSLTTDSAQNPPHQRPSSESPRGRKKETAPDGTELPDEISGPTGDELFDNDYRDAE